MALQKLREYFNETNRENFIEMLKHRVLVAEKIAAPSFLFRRTTSGFEFYKSSASDKLNIVDRTVISLYEMAINHLQSLPSDVKSQFPTDWKFGFEYLPETKASDITYEKTPTNNLILTHIHQLNEGGKIKKTINDPVILNKWAKILEVQSPNVIFDGYLSQEQRENLLELLSMGDREFADSFDYLIETSDKTSFTKLIFKIFNPNATASSLNSNLESEIDGLIVNFIDGKTMKSFKIEDFLRATAEKRDIRASSHTYQIAVTDFLEYATMQDLSEIKIEEESADYRYLEIMSVLFNGYIDKNSSKYIGVNFESAEFSTAQSFRLNSKYIKNEKTLKYVDNEILSELLKMILSSFRKKRTKATDLIDEDTLMRMNEFIDKVNEKIFVENTDENAVYDYNNFMLHNKIKTSVNLNEALNVKHMEQGKEPVNMFVGRFQPFTLGHAKVLESMYKENGFPVVVFLVKSKTVKKGDEFSRPYEENTQIEMFNKVKKQYPFLKEIFVVPSAAIDIMFNEVRPKYEPVLWGTGSDRMKAYGYMVNNDSYRDQLNVRADFALFEIARTDDEISATKVRNAMLDGNEKEFQSMTPNAIHPMYNELKSKLEDKMGVVAEDVKTPHEIMTFEQFINKF
jgi:nicotinamide mononucleotide adenylyltransferase